MGEVCQINGRIGFRGYTEKDIIPKEQGGVLAFTPTNIVNNQLTLNVRNTYITRVKYDESPEIMVKNGNILFVKTGSTLGKSALVTGFTEDSTVNPQVVVIKTDIPNQKILSTILTTDKVQSQVASVKIGGAVPTMTETELKNIELSMPINEDERIKIGAFFSKLDNIITLHQRECFSFDFSGESAKTAQKTISWEQRKLGELVVIERGGSPRPIDDYITDSPDGLNWVKIGDAPEQGNYITSTKEKIRPEGLSKTREVHPGDLILSNSMSFGKPYIMAIDGCIHDGWLSIKNTNNVFDLKFLCVLLGTDQMLTQYKSMAAGSTVNNLNKELVGNTTVTYPSVEEQRTIGQFFEEIENLITLHQHKPNKKGHDVLSVMPFKGNQRKPHYLCT